MDHKNIIGFLFLLMSFIVTTSNSYRILGLFPHPGLSHFHIFHPVMKGLAEAGHSVTVVSHFPNKVPINNYKDLQLNGSSVLTNTIDLKMFAKRFSFNHFIEFFLLKDWGKEACENVLSSTEIAEILKMKEKYDVIIMEQFNSDCMSGIAYKLQVPFIALSSCALMPWHYNRFGNPQIPSYIPALFMGYADKMTFPERIANWIAAHGLQFLYKHFTDRETNKIMRKYLGNDIPDVTELAKKTSLVMVNQHFSLSGVKPITPATVEIGGIHIKKAKPLDPELQELLDTADNGVIYISWGSMIRSETIPTEKREALLQVLGQFPQRILWKWENDTLPNKPSNVYIRKWLPQREILCHPKVRVFMTHGGLLGASEAAYCAVPVVATPMYGDQFLNSAALVNRQMGVLLHFEDFSKENIFNALKTALEPSYKENAKMVSYSFKNREKTPIETAIWHVEYVAATGGQLLKSNSSNLPWYIYHSLDVIFVILCSLIICILSWIYVLKKLFKSKITNSNTNKSKTQ